MAQDRVKQLLQQGMAAAKAGQKQQALEILQRVVKLDPRNESAWLWLSSVARNNQERIFCLRQLYSINPSNDLAIKGLQALGIDPTTEKVVADPTPTSDTPLPSPEKLRALQGRIDELVKQYRPELYTPLEIDWTQKENNRYGEATAKRIRRTFYGTVAAISIVALLLVGFLLYGLISSLGGNEEQASNNKGLFTATASLIPSITPTFTPNPNTPIPGNLFTTPTPVTPQANLPRGFDNRQPTPTTVYPPIQQSEIRDAITAFDQGDYETVRRISSPFQDVELNFCFQEMYYYDMVGRAQSGDLAELAEAEALLNQALNFEERPGFENTCEDSDLLKAALCYVDYQQSVLGVGNATDAQAICQEALEGDPQLVLAATTLADIYIDRGEFDRAAAVLEETRTHELPSGSQPNIGNVYLLLKQADVEVAQNNFDRGLEYVARALYVDPVLEEAIAKRVEINLLKARGESDSRLQQILYGYAALLAEEQYLFRYPGAAQAYVYVAEGRLREGNPDRALENLDRVIQVEGAPGVDPQAVQQAYALRAEVYFNQADYAAALTDLNRLLDENPDQLQWREWRAEAALVTMDYATAVEDLSILVEAMPERVDLVVELAGIQAQRCQYTPGVSCDYQAVLDALSITFVGDLSDPILQARAQAFRIEAQLALDESPTVNQLALWINTMQDVLAVHETGQNYFLLGRLQALAEDYEAALQAYEWVAYWNSIYDYPFGDDVAEAIDAANEALNASEDET